MGEFSTHEKANLAYTVKVLMNCFSSDANTATDRICQDPEAVALLALACRFSRDDVDSDFESTEAVALMKSGLKEVKI